MYIILYKCIYIYTYISYIQKVPANFISLSFYIIFSYKCPSFSPSALARSCWVQQHESDRASPLRFHHPGCKRLPRTRPQWPLPPGWWKNILFVPQKMLKLYSWCFLSHISKPLNFKFCSATVFNAFDIPIMLYTPNSKVGPRFVSASTISIYLCALRPWIKSSLYQPPTLFV